MNIRCFEGVGIMSKGEFHFYLDGEPTISIGRKSPWDSPPLGWIERSPSFQELSWRQTITRLKEQRKKCIN